MLLDVTGITVGKLKNTVAITAITTVSPLATQPKCPSSKGLVLGKKSDDLLLYISNAAGIA